MHANECSVSQRQTLFVVKLRFRSKSGVGQVRGSGTSELGLDQFQFYLNHFRIEDDDISPCVLLVPGGHTPVCSSSSLPRPRPQPPPGRQPRAGEAGHGGPQPLKVHV